MIKCSSCFYDFFIYTIIVNKELNVFVHLILCKQSCFSDCYPPLILECVAGMFVLSGKKVLCKLFSSLRTTLNDNEMYHYYHYYIYDTIRRLNIIMVATIMTMVMMMMMMMMMMMNCDSCCLIVPLTILLTGAQVKNLIN